MRVPDLKLSLSQAKIAGFKEKKINMPRGAGSTTAISIGLFRLLTTPRSPDDWILKVLVRCDIRTIESLLLSYFGDDIEVQHKECFTIKYAKNKCEITLIPNTYSLDKINNIYDYIYIDGVNKKEKNVRDILNARASWNWVAVYQMEECQ